MNIAKMYEAQKALRDRINYQGKDRYEKLVLALMVEIGEASNEWRGFKFWSQDQEPRRKKLLEELVDVLHFMLEVGIESGYRKTDWKMGYVEETITRQFSEMFVLASELIVEFEKERVHIGLVSYFIGLIKMLGFTWGEVEEAYFAKNKVNHERQDGGY
ncbi:hypothetical protein A374_08899 [Fictibacillus macauensis ZFHKF-1]|uniref:dUTPase n=1 Tax=Fictibacillus macauensis ZFHKF-1 TaxID=1196324 RepID=I8J2H4_9BACL|nr:dUTP diphosphatase [Fictibacillus macauensis]EIT85941.1 hypothetical protein A374_08899 [Fictibacillus macauensis ZFHKF-1]